MQKFYLFILLSVCFCSIFPKTSQSQSCSLLNATFTTYESRCAATGSIKVNVTGGSGAYKYKTIGPVNTNFTTLDSITGLSAGNYMVIISDIVTNCTFTETDVIVAGSYEDPRFTLTHVDVSCDHANNGSIAINTQDKGRSPFVYTIVAPSPMGVGTSNSTGSFNNLIAGDYSIQLTDSCGGIQTRQITINDYSWQIDSDVFNKISCDSASGYIKVSDSKGNVSIAGGIPGFMYGIVRSPGDTIWSSNPNFTFDLAGVSTFDIVAKDACGIIKKTAATVNLTPSVGSLIVITNTTCNSFTASIAGVTNFFTPNFCLYDKFDVLISCNSTGVFDNLPYGSYCITAHDQCTDTIIERCFTGVPPTLSVADNVVISNKICGTFSAAITGQNGLTNPNYCLYDSTNTLITCNTIGVFDSLSYGSYCIQTKDGCIDTTITRCFNAENPIPIVDTIVPFYVDCSHFNILSGTDSLTNPRFCLYDSVGTLIDCNLTGFFDSLAFGHYCLNIHDSCTDTTIIRCFDIGPEIIINDIAISMTNKTCSTFTATASSGNLKNAYYCLYNAADSLISCDSTGVFDNLSYGDYCIKSRNGCPDTTFTNCFSASPPVPAINNTVKTINHDCSTFTAEITNQQNLTNPQFCIYDNTNTLLSCNTTGIFDNLLYGSYCIKTINTCYDTTISRCFTELAIPFSLAATASKSCVYGYSKFDITVAGGALPVNIKVYNPNDSLVYDRNYNTSSIYIDTIPGVVAGQTYKVIATDKCGNKDSVTVGTIVGFLTHSPSVIAKCPGGLWANGSGDIVTTAASNMGSLTVRIIKKDGIVLFPKLNPSSVSGSDYTFSDLGPGTYIISYKANDPCNIFLHDTVTIQPYQFPNLDHSSAYQCDVNGFSVGAVVSNGVGPFTYSIIGSNPSVPSIIAGPQASPIFNINNGTTYSLIRLRALDACGNATLGDASVLPLSDDEIISSSNCLLNPTTLSVDSIYNSTYAWYKKTNASDTDSTFIGAASSVFIPDLLPTDTGVYICHIEVNSGCVKRTYYFNLNGQCYIVLPVSLTEFGGKFIDDKILLNWKTTNEHNVKNYVIERRNSYNTFTEIGKTNATGNSLRDQLYDFIDAKPDVGKNYYRLKIVYDDNTFSYSNIIILTNNQTKTSIHIYPNPVTDIINIDFRNSQNHVYKISLVNTISQLMKEATFTSGFSNTLQISRTKAMSPGMYIVRIVDVTSNEEFLQRIILK